MQTERESWLQILLSACGIDTTIGCTCQCHKSGCGLKGGIQSIAGRNLHCPRHPIIRSTSIRSTKTKMEEAESYADCQRILCHDVSFMFWIRSFLQMLRPQQNRADAPHNPRRSGCIAAVLLICAGASASESISSSKRQDTTIMHNMVMVGCATVKTTFCLFSGKNQRRLCPARFERKNEMLCWDCFSAMAYRSIKANGACCR